MLRRIDLKRVRFVYAIVKAWLVKYVVQDDFDVLIAVRSRMLMIKTKSDLLNIWSYKFKNG